MNPHYLERVLGTALLSHAEESALARRWRESGDRAARNLLVEAHLRLVPAIARRYYRPGASFSELVAEGNFALLHASGKFEPERGYRFATYARYWIRAYVSECAIQNAGSTIRLPRALRKVRREHIRAKNLVGEGGEARRLIAERLQMSAATIDGLVELLQQRHVSFESLHSEWHADGPLSATDASPEQALLHKTEQRSLEAEVREAVAALNVRERRIVSQRLMADVDATVTLLNLGREFGVSRERVRQLEVNLKRKLATRLRALSGSEETTAPKIAA
jgi:RNA polymerase sigma-32 factor